MIPPDLIEQAALDLLGERLSRHLATLERHLGLQCCTITRPHLDLIGADTGITDAVLLAIDGADDPEEHEDTDGRWLRFDWRLRVEVRTFGGGPNPSADTQQRARWLGMAALSCLVADFAATHELVDSVTAGAIDFSGADLDDDRQIGRCDFTVICSVPTTIRVFPEPGETEATDPCEAPVQWPEVSSYVITVDRDPITQP